MRTTRLQAAADRRSAANRRDLAQQVSRLCDDAGLTQRALADAAGLARSYVGRILAGDARPSLETYGRVGAVLGADLAMRYYPHTGPVIRDRHQARMLEALLAILHVRWHAFLEVAVRRPGRGWIDAALHDPRASLLVATELQSELRRLEQIVRWSAEKAASLPSWDGWVGLGAETQVSRLLVVRRTRATRAVAADFAAQIQAAYPAHPDDALAALAGTAPWPGPSLVWAVVDGARTCLVPGR
jgi:transcriptional regulator with XRE-family HTH domain